MSFRWCSSMFSPSPAGSPPPSPFVPPSPSPLLATPAATLPIFSQPSSPLPTLTLTPFHVLPPSRQGSIGPVHSAQRRGGGGRVEDPELPSLTQVERPGPRPFQFQGKNYFLTWSQIGDRPNSKLADIMTNFRPEPKCKSDIFYIFIINSY